MLLLALIVVLKYPSGINTTQFVHRMNVNEQSTKDEVLFYAITMMNSYTVHQVQETRHKRPQVV